ncbi:SIR2 family protein [Vibrio harveyi]
MNINEFIGNYHNHPILFIGTGISLRYLSNSFSWDGLLEKISVDLTGDNEFFYNVKGECCYDGKFAYDEIAEKVEEAFNQALKADRDGKFKEINDIFFENMKNGINTSRFKIYITELLSELEYRDAMSEELKSFKKARKNISSIVTTNYDTLIEDIFQFKPLIGNNILLSNPYGSVYKIHGCVTDASKVIITKEDYDNFEKKFELIRAQLLSMFIHNPIVFLGYNIGDENIKSILKTIFTYVEKNSPEAEKIRNNFLLVEYDPESESVETCEHDIDMQGFATIRINKIKTNNFTAIYEALADLSLPVSAMDVRKVQNIVKEIYAGGSIKVNITEDLDSINNSDKIIAIGSVKTITYSFQTTSEMMSNYFDIIEESNSQLLELIDKHRIQTTQYFPMFAFSDICSTLTCAERLKQQQIDKIEGLISRCPPCAKVGHESIVDIENDESIAATNKYYAIVWSTYHGKLQLDEVEAYLRQRENKDDTNYRAILCTYDLVKYR